MSSKKTDDTFKLGDYVALAEDPYALLGIIIATELLTVTVKTYETHNLIKFNRVDLVLYKSYDYHRFHTEALYNPSNDTIEVKLKWLFRSGTRGAVLRVKPETLPVLSDGHVFPIIDDFQTEKENPAPKKSRFQNVIEED